FENYLGQHPFGLIGNFPYNISSQIVFKMLDNRAQIPEMVGMFQHEMAARVVAGPGSKTYGVISVLTQAYYEGEYLFLVDRSCFSPPPKVQSAVIRLTRKKELNLRCNDSLFKKVVKQAFSQRRKMLRNTLKPLIKDAEVLQSPFFTKRPEVLSVEDFINLTEMIEAQSI
ncbi:MAG: rRNA adenine dimethyltransferase family protein, partial [Bacteroidota bacterium]